MKQSVLISGASIAGMTLAYWLNRYGYQVTVVELAKGLRRGGSPIDVRGEALTVAKEMGIYDKIKQKEFIHSDRIVNAQNEILVRFALNKQSEYLGDIEIHRDDLIDILFESVPHSEVEMIFENRLVDIDQKADQVNVSFKDGQRRSFDFVFGADGTHSAVRQLVFGEESLFRKSFGAYFAIVETPDLVLDRAETGAFIYQEVGKVAALYPFKNSVNAMLAFRGDNLNWDYRNLEQHKQFLKDNFSNSSWRIPEMLEKMVHSENLYFDEICQIHMPGWSSQRVALVGDAGYTAGFPTGMGTSLAMQGAMILANALRDAKGDYEQAFQQYYERHLPSVEAAQAKIVRGLNWLLPKTQQALQQSIDRFKE